MHKELTLQQAFDKATGKKSSNYHGYFRVHVDSLDKDEVTKLYEFKDTYHPSELNLKRSGIGITILVKA